MIHWLSSRFFFPLAALSAVALLLHGAWQLLVGPWPGPRLDWNLFLAWVPYLMALAAVGVQQRRPESSWLFWPIMVAWLSFFPNAPYLVTDWRYLPGWTDELWYSVVMMTTFSLCGLFLAGTSLYLIQTLVAVRTSRPLGNLTATTALVLSGLGVYLGRFIRLNSWDFVTAPAMVFTDIAASFQAQTHHLGPIGFSLLFTLMLGAFYYAFLQVRHSHWSREELHVWETPVGSLPVRHAGSKR